ncbi:hypothetical protein K431DRAFT_80406 [Polychaeton citri CBS 116435]|uniref:Uncharacterized protein n=1 Tax=Polychaeton citri CBS 116435 TaxID=1314669 RepID=A0A9P4QHC8_9PEZI|nr:hypothetical protein K431DRAFT_80406 [Polychaeton citri CBS 116435]
MTVGQQNQGNMSGVREQILGTFHPILPHEPFKFLTERKANARSLYRMINTKAAPSSLEVITKGAGATIQAAVVLNDDHSVGQLYGFMRGKDAPTEQQALEVLLDMTTQMLEEYWETHVVAEPLTKMVDGPGGWYNIRQPLETTLP